MEKLNYNAHIDIKTGVLQFLDPDKGWYIGDINQPWKLVEEFDAKRRRERWICLAIGAAIGFLVCAVL